VLINDSAESPDQIGRPRRLRLGKTILRLHMQHHIQAFKLRVDICAWVNVTPNDNERVA
jgi:hypothetical protein